MANLPGVVKLVEMARFESSSQRIDDWQADHWVKELSQFTSDISQKSAFWGENRGENVALKHKDHMTEQGQKRQPTHNTQLPGSDDEEDDDDSPAQITISLASLLKASKLEDKEPDLIHCTLTDLVLGSGSGTIRDVLTSLNKGEKPKTKAPTFDIKAFQLPDSDVSVDQEIQSFPTEEKLAADLSATRLSEASAMTNEATVSVRTPSASASVATFPSGTHSPSSSSSSLSKSKLNVNAAPFEPPKSKDPYCFDPSEYYEPSTLKSPMNATPALGGADAQPATFHSTENQYVSLTPTLPTHKAAGCLHEFNGDVYYDDDAVM